MPTSGIVVQSLSKKSKAKKGYTANMELQRKNLCSNINQFSLQKSDKSSIYKPALSLM